MERFFVSRPVFAIAIALGMVILGFVAIRSLSIEQYPDITPPVVEISASYPGADALTVDEAVATPIAQQVMGVGQMLYMQSTSADDGSMNLQVTFAIGSDPDMDAIFSQNRVSEATPSLPQSVTEQGITTQKTMSGFLIVYSLFSDGRYDDLFLSNYAYLHIQDELLKIDGVGKVEVMGAGEYAMRIWLKPDLLSYYNLSVEEVREAILAQSGIYPAGKFGAEPTSPATTFTYTVRMPHERSTPEEFGKIVVRAQSNGEQLLLEQIAEIELGARSYGATSAFGNHPSALIVIYQQPGSNAVEVGARVREVMQGLSERFYDGIDFSTIVDATDGIRVGIRDIIATLLIALVLVVSIIYLFLQNWRATLIPLIAIPVSLIGAFALFPLLGFTINIISLLGMVLAIGLVVDDAIVVVEAVQLNLAAGMPPKEATIKAMQNVSAPIIATTVVLLAVFVPVSFSGGITGLLFQQFAITIAVSVVLSAFNALTLSPALCSLLLRDQRPPQRGLFARFNRWFDRSMAGYDDSVKGWLRHAGRTLFILIISVITISVLWITLPKGFLPEEDQGYLMVMVETPPASSLERTQKAIEQIDRLILNESDVEATTYAAGFDMMAGVASTNHGILFIKLKPYKERKRSAMELAEELTEELYAAAPEALCYAFTPPSIPGLGVSSGLSLELQDLEAQGGAWLEEQSQELIAALEKSPEIASATTQYNGSIPQRQLSIDRERALAQGVDLSELYREISTLLGGSYLNNFSRFGRLYQSYLQAAPDYRTSKEALAHYYITGSSGEEIPLSELITVRDTVGPGFITQFNLYRSISLNITPAAGTSSSDAMALVERTAQEVLPKGAGISWSGLSYQQATAAGSEGWVYALALIFVYLALASLYNSWSLPWAILLSVPMAVAGALLFVSGGHWVDRLVSNDIYLQISLVMLIGLAAKNAILVVEYANRLFFEQGLDLREAAVGAARLRIRPILMTAFAFILGVLPLVFATGLYTTARHVMGIALVGGMLAATLLGIFLYPALYYHTARLFGFERKRERLTSTSK